MADGAERPDFLVHFERGIEHFNQREFWEAHEAWEEIWLHATSEAHQFLQGLIQLAAAYHHIKRGTLRGAVRLFDAALARLDPFPPHYCAVDRIPLIEICRQHREIVAGILSASPGHQTSWPGPIVAAFPQIRRSENRLSPVPPGVDW